MKRFLLLLLCCALLCCAALSEADYSAILLDNTWVTIDGSMEMFFQADGSGYFSFAMGKYDTTWTIEGNTVTAAYEMYGPRAFVLDLTQTDQGWRLASADGAATFFAQNSLDAVLDAQKDQWGYALTKDEKITLPFVEISLNRIEKRGYIGKTKEDGTVGAAVTPSEGNTFVAFEGTINNTSNQEFAVSNIRAEFIFDGDIHYPASCYVIDGEIYDYKVAPRKQMELYIAAQIPQDAIQDLNSCTLVFSFNNNLAVAPGTAHEGEFLFNRSVNEEEFAIVKQKVARQKYYFDESPALPLPSSYTDVRSNGMSRTGSKGSYKSIQYSYSPAAYQGSVDDLILEYMKGLLLDGYEVTGKGDPYVISLDGRKLATVTKDLYMKMDIDPGNEDLKISANGKASVVVAEKEPDHRIKKANVGGTIKANTSQLQLIRTASAEKLMTSETARRYYYYEPNLPNTKFFYIIGKFTNQCSTTVDIRRLYVDMTFDGKYTYEADATAILADASKFSHDVLPMGTVDCYLYTEVPNTVLNSYKTCVVRVGFTDDFYYHVRKNGGLDWDRCDEIYEITITR